MTRVEAQPPSVDAILKEGARHVPSHLGPVDRGYWAIHAFAKGKLGSGRVGITPESCTDFVTLDRKGRQVPVGRRLVALVNSAATGLSGKIPTTFEEGMNLVMGSELVKRPKSLDTPITRHGSDEDVFGDFVVDPTVDVAESVAERMDISAQIRRLREALPTLEPEQIDILFKRFNLEMEIQEIAASKGVHVNTVSKRIGEAFEELRRILGSQH